jgi:hypothetical protein
MKHAYKGNGIVLKSTIAIACCLKSGSEKQGNRQAISKKVVKLPIKK